MNYQGTTFKNFLIVMPVMFGPVILASILSIFMENENAIIAMTIIGIICMLLAKPIFNVCVKKFNKRKYAMADGFRASE